MDPRTKELAHKLIHYSTHLEKGERILIEISGQDAYPLAEASLKKFTPSAAILICGSQTRSSPARCSWASAKNSSTSTQDSCSNR